MIKSALDTLLEQNPELNISVNDYNINVTSNQGSRLNSLDLFDAYKSFNGVKQDAHLYLHVPLCNYICHFCNYVKRKIDYKSMSDELTLWANLLIKESEIYLKQVPWIQQANIRSFYIGGGTGALLLNNKLAFQKLIDHINTNFMLVKDCERSLEGNPDNYTNETLELALELGFNRFSVGIQSLQDEVTKFTNRGHTAEQALHAVQLLKSKNLPFSVDMMFGLPYQTPESVARDIQILVDFGVPSITIYRFRNAEREKMGIGNASLWNFEKVKKRMTEDGLFPDVLSTYRMRDAITKILRSNGYHPSPCGWWNLPNTYPDGNIPRLSKDKWEKYNTMIAFGPGAYGWLTGSESQFIQTHNITDINQYINFMETANEIPPLAFGRILSDNIAIGTRLSFAFKANQPIKLKEYIDLFGVDLMYEEPYSSVFNKLIDKDLMSLSSDNSFLIPTWKGEELHEEIMYYYFHKIIGGSNDFVCKHQNRDRNLV